MLSLCFSISASTTTTRLDSSLRVSLLLQRRCQKSIPGLSRLRKGQKGEREEKNYDAFYALCLAVEIVGVLAKWKERREQMENFYGCVQILNHILKNGRNVEMPSLQL
ncbi:hypothetical protein HN51_071119 [Arachis hypogaea]